MTDDPDGINWIKIGDATRSGKYIYETREKITQAGVGRSRMVYEGDFLLSNSMSFGRPYVMKTTGCIHDGWLVLTADAKRVDQDFLYLMLGSAQVFQQFDTLAAGSTVRNLNIGLVERVVIPLPPLDEQKRIVEVLDAAFEGLTRARAHTETNLQNARDLFESMLESVVADAAARWPVTALAGLTASISDGDHAAPPKAPEGVPFITISNVDKETLEIDFSDTFKVPQGYYDALKDNRKPRQGDVLYSVTGSFGIPVHVKESAAFCFQRHIGLVRPKQTLDSRWLFFLLLSPHVYRQADEGASGTAQRTVSLTQLRSFAVPDVPFAEQVKFAATLDTQLIKSRQLQSHYRAKLADLDALRQALLQKAFAGELVDGCIEPSDLPGLTSEENKRLRELHRDFKKRSQEVYG